MPLNRGVGDAFPDVALLDDRGDERTIGAVAAGQPLFLALFRGPW